MQSQPIPIPAIVPDVLYPKESAKQFLGGEMAWRSAMKQGLKQSKRGKRVYVLGRELIRYIVGDEALAGS